MKSVEEIYETLRDGYAGRTGYTPPDGSEFALRLYAYAAQIQSLFVHMDWVETQSFPQTASGDALTLHAETRGLSRKEGTRATGRIIFGRDDEADQALSIPAGMICMNENWVRFETIESGVIPAGERMTAVYAQSCETGISGNTASGTVALMSLPPTGVSWCTNPSPFSGGQDTESDDALRVRLLDSFRRLPNGANAAFYQIEAMRHDGVAAADVLPRVNGRGTVGVVIATADGLPPQSLLNEVGEHLQALREIATDVIVSAPVPVPVTLSVQVTPQDGISDSQACQNAEAALAAFFDGTRLGKPVLLRELQHILHETPGVRNYRILTPTADQDISPGQLPTLDSLTIQSTM